MYRPGWAWRAVVLVFLAAFLCAGCGNGGDGDESGKRGGTVVIGSQTKPAALNPLLTSSSVSTQVYGLIFDGLTERNRDQMASPDLAERWEISEDGLIYTFYLRRGVRFHDGTECTAEDVKFTYETARNPAYNRAGLSQVERVEALDRYTVRITLVRVVPRFLAFSATFSVLPKHLLEGGDFHTLPFNRHPVGTGPFRFEAWEADSTRLVLAANEDYFDGRPHLDLVVFWTGLDQSELWVRLMRQEIDVIQSLTPEDMEYVRVDSMTFTLYPQMQLFYHVLLYNLDNSRFKDRRVRLALSHALDRQALADRALLGHGALSSGPFQPDSWAYDSEIRPVPYDPPQALRLLSEAGWIDRDGDGVLDKRGRPFEVSLLIYKGDRVQETMALVIRQHLQEIGIRIRVERFDFSILRKERLLPGAFDMALLTYNAGQDPDTAELFWHSKSIGGYNFARYRNPEVDRLLDAGNSTIDRGERRRIYRQIHRIMAKDQPAMFLFFRNQFEVVNRRIAGVESGWGYSIYQSVTEWYVVPQS